MNDRQLKEQKLTLDLLDTIDRRGDISQRHLASHMGIALGLANSYLRRCAKKGWVKVRDAPANRYFYYLTPKGFGEKARLTTEYLSTSFNFYRQAGDSCARIFCKIREDGYQEIVLYGLSDLAEIAYLRAIESNLVVRQIIQADANAIDFFGVPVVDELDLNLQSCACLITDITSPVETATSLLSLNLEVPVYMPDIMGVQADGILSDIAD